MILCNICHGPYHTTNLIKKYGSLNEFSTETYESLYKNFVKSPYYLTNKKDIEIQILKMIQRQDIVTKSKLSAKSNQNAKIIYPFKFNNLIWKFNLNNAQEFINEELKNNNLNSKLHFGLNNLLEYLNIYFGLIEQNNLNNSIVKIYSLVTIQNGLIIHATNSYYRKACYSNVAIAINFEELSEYLSDQGICYRQKTLFYYGCSRLQLTKIYNIINIETIKDNVHIIPRFDKDNDYLANKYIF
ncbi:zn-finger domain-containing protein [Gigaspora margarita]|uniref:Zn-finger domain-containing protein n=1 Tax=Gigaspora margarita TaxID=4874 RepID=A0A8H4ABX1_GIGMA|nr:zn-finger domain-containing protein [Gigaspora margarita]